MLRAASVRQDALGLLKPPKDSLKYSDIWLQSARKTVNSRQICRICRKRFSLPRVASKAMSYHFAVADPAEAALAPRVVQGEAGHHVRGAPEDYRA